MSSYDLSINIKSASDTGAVRSVDDLLGRLQRTAGELNQRLSSVSQGGGQAERVLNSMSGEARALNDRLLAVSQSAQQTAGNLETVGNAGHEAAEGLEQATKAADGAGKSAETAGRGAQDSGLKWANVAGALYTVQAAYRAVQRGAEMAYQTVREGADLEWIERRFDNLSRSIGSSGEQLLATLDRTTMGLLSQAEAMGLAADLIGLQLVSTEGEASRLAGVVAGLGMNVNQLVLTLTNQTTARFDQLGVAVGGFEERLKRLEAQGLSTDKAFLWAFIEQAEESMARAGSRADELTGKLDILEATWADAVAGMKQDAAATAEPIIEWLVEIIEKAREAQNEIDRLKNPGPGDSSTEQEWLAFIRGVDKAIASGTKAHLVGQLDEMHAAQQEAILNYAKMIDSAEEFAQAMTQGYSYDFWRDGLFAQPPSGYVSWDTIYKTASESQRAFFRAMEIDSLEAFHSWARLQQQAEQADTAMLNANRAATDGLVRQRAEVDALARSAEQADRAMLNSSRQAVNARNEQTEAANEYSRSIEGVAAIEREMTYTTPQNVRAGQERAAAMAEQMAAADELEAAMRKLEETTAGYFDTIRKGGELDYDEIFYEATRAAGADERAIADLMVAQGKWTQAQADAKVAQAELGAQTEILGATWQAAGLSAEGAILAQQYLTTGMYDSAEAAIRAAKYGSVMAGTLETEVSPALRTGRDAAQEYGGALGGIPEDVTTEIETPGLPEATTNAIDYYTELGFIPDFVETEVRTPGMSSAIEDASTLDGYLRGIPAEVTSTIRVVTFASGGAYDPGLGTYVPPSSGGGNPSTPPGAAGSFAGGTSGWLEMPGPRGKSHLIEVHGGEGLNVNPDGIPAGGEGNTYNTYHNQISIVVEGRRSDLPTGEATPFLDAIRALGFTV